MKMAWEFYFLLPLAFVQLTGLEARRDYWRKRDKLLREDAGAFLGSDLSLTLPEQFANSNLMEKKKIELDVQFKNLSFPLSKSFLEVKPEIEASKVFNFIRKDYHVLHKFVLKFGLGAVLVLRWPKRWEGGYCFSAFITVVSYQNESFSSK